MRIAYIILSYNLPQQLRGLVKMLDTAESTSVVFVHHDAKSPPLPDDFISGFAKTRLAPRRFAVTWGDFSQVEALVSCLRAVVDTVEFDWIVVLSGQDFPCRPISHFAEFLASSRFDAFVEAAPIERCARPAHTFARYYYRHWTLPHFAYAYKLPSRVVRAWDRTLAQFVDSNGLLTYIWMPRGLPGRIGIRSLGVPFRRDFICHQGSDWLNLSRKATQHLLRVIDETALMKYYRRTVLPSESIFQTILCNARALSVCPRNLRWIKWSSSDAASPETLTVADFAALTRSEEFFARKFDMRVDSRVLDLLEAAVAGPRSAQDVQRSP